MLRVLPNRRKMQRAVTQHERHLMLHILSILLALIVRERILAFPELVVPAAILPYVRFDARTEGRGAGGGIAAAGIAVVCLGVVAGFESGGGDVVDVGIGS